MSVFVIGEIGINHNGDIKIAKKLINGAVKAGANAVKFQKRTISVVYSQEELDKPRESPFGTTNREQKNGLEFTRKEYDVIDRYCKKKGIEWLASAWDIESQIFLRRYDNKYNKVASALLTHSELLNVIASEKKHTFVSTGMSTLDEIGEAVKIFKIHNCPFELLHCNSTYPMKNEDANLAAIETLREEFGCDVGYSGHEAGRIVSVAAAAMGVSTIERHITLDKAMYGSDQAASLEITDFKRLIKDIRTVEDAMGSPEIIVYETEVPIKQKLRKVDTL